MQYCSLVADTWLVVIVLELPVVRTEWRHTFGVAKAKDMDKL